MKSRRRYRSSKLGRIRFRIASLQGRLVLAVASLCCTLALQTSVLAEVQRVKSLTSTTDGVYGRFNGDLTWSFRAATGVELTSGRVLWGPSIGLDFLSTMGVYVSGTSPGVHFNEKKNSPQSTHSSQPPIDVWLVSTGLELRPLFLPRWVFNLEQGPAWLDLTLDSLTFFGGVVFPLSEESVSSEFGVALGTPISGHFRRPEVDGLWFEVKFLRQSRAGTVPSQATLWLGLSWRSIQSSGLLSSSAN